jgi:YD repeat-containing protein
VTTHTSDELGWIRTALDGRGVTITYYYDERDRVVEVGSSHYLTVTYDHDGNGSVPVSGHGRLLATWAVSSPKAREGEVRAWWRRPDRSWRSV